MKIIGLIRALQNNGHAGITKIESLLDTRGVTISRVPGTRRQDKAGLWIGAERRA
jgi:hypothetical protein